ncbi:MAG TPA: transglutaminase domain-containing protein [Bacteroidales bacterium]|nr:transglutaminase domain-containing protein [Bacteroidales bacterium]
MKELFSTLALILLITASGCARKNLIKDPALRKKIESGFRDTKNTASERQQQLFEIFSGNLSAEEKEALKYLYAYMPLSDLADYNGRFFLDNVSLAIKARKETEWGRTLPDDIFLRYVLPLRVNNENLDSFRIVCYREIMQRIKGLNAEEAALEINHWCHEKVTYQPSDSRTSGPVSTILSARGRCGEESVLTVSALRTACLPARQVYAPRWSHTDDNHAWVEVWINGEWKYMGACEPEPYLNRGWFTDAASRSMLIHAKPFGHPSTGKNVISVNRNYSVVNILPSYAPTRKITARVNLRNSDPADAEVDIGIFNYAEFYPVATLKPASDGVLTFETGYGDFLLWASSADGYDFRIIRPDEKDTVILTPVKLPPDSGEIDIDITVPAGSAVIPELPEDIKAINKRRLSLEDSLREEKIKTWMSEEEAGKMAAAAGADIRTVKSLIKKSAGNYNEIVKLLKGFPEIPLSSKLAILEQVSEKDLRDTPAEVLAGHLMYLPPGEEWKNYCSEEIYLKYLLNPRIADELLSGWRKYFAENLTEDFRKKGRENPEFIVEYVNSAIRHDNTRNNYGTPLSPRGTHELKIADDHSRKIYFVALCRSAGVPAKIGNGTGRPRYFYRGEWNDVYFSDEIRPQGKGFLKIENGHKDFVPQYYKHFTIGRYENGRFSTLEYDYDLPVTSFDGELALPAGNYWLVTGNRTDERNILAHISFFAVKPDDTTSIKVTVRGK